jgi:peroxiredoxin
MSVAVGDTLPPVALPDVRGGTIRLADFLGRRLFIFMWASW